MQTATPELIFLHGFLGGPAVWDATLAYLACPTAHAWALPGHHAGAPIAANATWHAALDALAAALQARPARPHVVGYSLGARVALGLLERNIIDRATLISVHPGLRTDTERLARRRSDAAWQAVLLTQPRAQMLAAWRAQPLFASQRRGAPHELATRHELALTHATEGLVASLQSMGLAEMPAYHHVLTANAHRIQLVVGADDAKFAGLAQDLAASTPGLRVHTIPACGHDPTLEAPAALAQHLAAWHLGAAATNTNHAGR